MAKWKCEICGKEFENFHAQGFDNKIHCPLCYFKRENADLKQDKSKCIIENFKLQQRIDKAIELLENYQNNLYSKEARKLLDDDVEISIKILKGDNND